jgi:outer membrane protein insertion porin family
MRWLAISAFAVLLAISGIAGQGTQKKRPPAVAPKVVAPADAPTLASEATKHPLQTVHFTGNKRIGTVKILQASGLKIGQPVDQSDFEAARARLLATGAFESIGFSYEPVNATNGYDATFELVEVVQMFPYVFEDLPGSDKDLRAVVTKQAPIFGSEIPATRPILAQLEHALSAAIGGGVVEAHMLATLRGGEPKLVFRRPGDRPRISEVHFSGNHEIDSDKLALAFAEVAIGSEFKEVEVRALLDRSVRPLYEARGFIRVAFPKMVAVISTEPEVRAVALTVTVDEGAAFKLGKVTYAGGEAREMNKAADLRGGDIVNFDEVKKAEDNVVQRYRGKGYLHAAVKTDREIHDDQHTVDLRMTLDPGPRFVYGKLAIEGLDIFGEPAIRKMWGDREGQPYDVEAPDAFLKDVHDQGLFDNLGKTSSKTKIDEAAHSVDVTLVFEGTKGAPGRGRGRRAGF